MNIAIFTDNFYPELGGIQDSTLLLGRTLGRRGHRVFFCAPSFSRRDCRIAQVPYSEIDIGPHVSVRRFRSIHCPSPTLQSRLVFPTLLRWHALKREAIDLIHTHTFLGVGLEALSAVKYLGVPLIGTNHWAVAAFDQYGPMKQTWFQGLSLRYVSWYYNHCDYVIAPSQSVLTEMERYHLRAPHSLVSNPIDTDTFSPGDGSKLKESFGLSDFAVTFAGRLGKEKCIDVIIRAVGLLRDALPHLTFAIAGHGSEEAALRALARQEKVADRVIFTGTLSQPRLAELLRASELFAIASTSETQSMTLLQAMACGVPAVGVNSRALPEYIHQKENGILVAPDDPRAMADAILHLARHPELRQSYGNKAAQIVHARYGLEAIAVTMEGIYQKLVKNTVN